MHGTNVIRKREYNPYRLQVREIFLTIQGEGPLAGERAVFIRFSGCHLACTFCDTTWDDENDPYLSVDDINREAYQKWGDLPRPLFVLTGGEPLRQDLSLLIPSLLGDATARVQVETAGNFFQEVLTDPRVVTVVSPKLSHVSKKVAEYANAYKYVVREGDNSVSLPQSTQKQGTHTLLPLPLPGTDIYVSPCDEQDPVKNLANVQSCKELVMKHGYKLSLQVHKLIDVP